MNRPRFATSAMFAVALAGCGTSTSNQAAKDQAAADQSSQSGATPGSQKPSTPTDRLLAAAEPFEALTETAFTDPADKLDRTIASGRTEVADVRSLLSPDTATKIDALLRDVERYRASGNKADLALSSIEIYRNLVNSVPTGTKIPVEVSLLDYSGFRFQADLKASPIRWSDMKEAVSFGQARWAALSPKVTDKRVAAPFENALADMRKSVEKRDSSLAHSSVTAELDQVDKLEAFFNVR